MTTPTKCTCGDDFHPNVPCEEGAHTAPIPPDALAALRAINPQWLSYVVGDSATCETLRIIATHLPALIEAAEREQAQPASPTWPHVLRFAKAMESKLDYNRHKGDREGWLRSSPESLFAKLVEEAQELNVAIEYNHSTGDILGEAADVANFAMMIADKVGVMRQGIEANLEQPAHADNPLVAIVRLQDQLTAERAEVARLKEVVGEKHADIERLQRVNAELVETLNTRAEREAEHLNALENARVAAESRVTKLEGELTNIARAKPREWGELSGDFEGWAKSRARQALKGGAK